MANFKSLNSSKANIQSVEEHNKNSETAVSQQTKEKKESAMDKYNINGQNQRGHNRTRH